MEQSKQHDFIIWEPGKDPVRIAAEGREGAVSMYMHANVSYADLRSWSPVQRQVFVTAATGGNVYDFTVTVEIDVRQTEGAK